MQMKNTYSKDCKQLEKACLEVWEELIMLYMYKVGIVFPKTSWKND
jgi:hypothetical protein